MIVIADTSPINYLIRIGQIHVLQAIYERVLIPHAVHDELLAQGAPLSVRAWAKNLPGWVEAVSPLTARTAILKNLDEGETEAILLAQELCADWLLIDETAGRAEATRRGLKTIGTLGILLEANKRGLLPLRECLKDLHREGFYVSNNLIDRILESIEPTH
jgi:predicted nucleic acid-binding protein